MLVVVVGLVGHNDDFLARLAKKVSNAFIKVGDSITNINKEENDICLLDCDFDLLVDFIFEDVFRIDHPSTCIDE